MSKKRVVITGLGSINSIGTNVEDTWKSLLAGMSGIGYISRFDTTDMPSKIAAEIKDYDPLNYFDPKNAKKMDLYTHFALIAAAEAVKDADLVDTNIDKDRIGVILGAGIGGILTFEEEANKMFVGGPRKISPFFIPKMISNIAAAHIAIEYGFKGINFNISSACSSANHALGTAFRSIQYGDADIIVSGGCEAAITPMAVGGFCALKALSTNNEDPSKASRPFDAMRDGFVMGEGAAILVLEELEHAKARGAKIYAELIGYGATDDAFHITAPAEMGEGSARAMIMALKDGGIKPEDVQYINAHGTSTQLNDKYETMSIKTVFGEYAYKVKVSSTKSMVGHMLGAAAGIEAQACILSIRDGKIHPTINLEHPDPECDLNYVPNHYIEHPVQIALSNSLGFGGHNVAIVFKKYES
ncbi:MAG TPA: beta-ketoacyl-ACP synthase II [Candidatus Cloacimonadota bacterium]|nr:beta-ketoacyl-ACP synthase II [Candidatus Cloacimonadota bacterium]